MQKMERIKIIGVDISVVNFNSAQKYLFDNFEEARGHYICAANVHTLQPMKIIITEKFRITLS